MPRFEVFVPAAPPKLPIDLTLRIDAEHWLAALKTGLQRLGETQMTNNVLCDIQGDGSIHVTDSDSGRVFRIQELAQPQVTTAPAPRRPSSQVDRVEVAREPTSPPRKPIGRITQTVRTEDVLADLFLAVAGLGSITDRTKGLGDLLDLAMRSIGCEAGSVFTTDLGAADLTFAVARGPSADKLLALGLKVPMGVGIVGFCALENVCLAVSDAQKDPRFHRAVSQAVGYETRSLLCAPVAYQGKVLGALEVLNKQDGKPFGQEDLAILSYLAAQAATFLERLSPNPFH